MGGAEGVGRGGGGPGGDDGAASPDMTEHVRLMFEITWGPMLAVFGEVSLVARLEGQRERAVAQVAGAGRRGCVGARLALSSPARERLERCADSLSASRCSAEAFVLGGVRFEWLSGRRAFLVLVPLRWRNRGPTCSPEKFGQWDESGMSRGRCFCSRVC